LVESKETESTNLSAIPRRTFGVCWCGGCGGGGGGGGGVLCSSCNLSFGRAVHRTSRPSDYHVTPFKYLFVLPTSTSFLPYSFQFIICSGYLTLYSSGERLFGHEGQIERRKSLLATL